MDDINEEHSLSNCPKLWQWFRQNQIERPNKNYELFLMSIVRGLISPQKEAARHCVQGLDTFLRSSTNPQDDFLTADSLCQELGKPLTELLSLLSESAIRCGEGHRIFTSLQSLAAKTNLTALRFLCAWTALNLGDLQTCIDECEKEAEAHGPIHTLLGQALLESGRTAEAIDAFMVSIKLDPTDVLALFQLVKALLVSDRAADAIPIAKRCREICGENTEVDCLSAMVVIADCAKNQEFATQTLDRLVRIFKEDPNNLDLLCLAFDVTEVKNDQTAILGLVQEANFEGLAQCNEFTSRISSILRKLGDKGWYIVSKHITDKLLSLETGLTSALRQ